MSGRRAWLIVGFVGFAVSSWIIFRASNGKLPWPLGAVMPF